MASALRSGLMLVVLLLASVFFLPWARIVPWRASDIDRRPAIGVMSLQSDRHIDAVDAALIGRDLPRRHLSPDDPADWADEERINAHARDASRAELIDRLTRPGPRACTGPDRAALIDAVQFYYNTRRRQIAVFSRRGPRAAAYVATVWSTVMDQRIDELIQTVARWSRDIDAGSGAGNGRGRSRRRLSAARLNAVRGLRAAAAPDMIAPLK